MGLGELEDKEISIRLNVFNGGLNDTVDPIVDLSSKKGVPGKMTPFEAREISNVDFSKTSKIASRKGREEYTTTELPEDPSTSLGLYVRSEYL